MLHRFNAGELIIFRSFVQLRTIYIYLHASHLILQPGLSQQRTHQQAAVLFNILAAVWIHALLLRYTQISIHDKLPIPEYITQWLGLFRSGRKYSIRRQTICRENCRSGKKSNHLLSYASQFMSQLFFSLISDQQDDDSISALLLFLISSCTKYKLKHWWAQPACNKPTDILCVCRDRVQ